MEIFDILFPEEYIANKETGEKKTKWHNLGSMVKGQKADGSEFMFLKPLNVPHFALSARDENGNPISYLLRKREQVQKAAPAATAKPATAATNDYSDIPF